jgi:uncharacterized protein (TIGR03086 family)
VNGAMLTTVDVREIYARCSAGFTERVHAVDGRWDAPTPLPGWDVRELVNHLVNEERWTPPLLGGATIEEVGDRFDGDQLGDDPEAAWAAAASGSIAAVAEDGALDSTVHVSFGDISGREYVSQLTCDHLIHGWDLARAIGLDEQLDPELVDFAYDFLGPQVDGWRSAGVFGPAVEVPAGASRQDQLLGLTGRQP